MKIEIEGRSVWVNYHHLYCFHLIATLGGLTPASQVLKIGTSALSIQMKQFEESLGFELFERSHRKMSPNERGRIVLAYTKEIFRLGTEMVEALNDRRSESRIHLKLGALASIPKHLPLQLVSEAHGKMSCMISLLEGKQDALLNDLLNHRIDLVLTNFLPHEEPDRFYSKRIARFKVWVVGTKKFKNLAREFPRSLAGAPFVVPTHDSLVRAEFENFTHDHGLRTDIVAEAQDVMVQKLLCVRGLGVTLIPEFAVREYIETKQLFKIGELPQVTEEVFLLSASRKIQNPVASFLMSRSKLL